VSSHVKHEATDILVFGILRAAPFCLTLRCRVLDWRTRLSQCGGGDVCASAVFLFITSVAVG
jgi:hypothetical protein